MPYCPFCRRLLPCSCQKDYYDGIKSARNLEDLKPECEYSDLDRLRGAAPSYAFRQGYDWAIRNDSETKIKMKLEFLNKMSKKYDDDLF